MGEENTLVLLFSAILCEQKNNQANGQRYCEQQPYGNKERAKDGGDNNEDNSNSD